MAAEPWLNLCILLWLLGLAAATAIGRGHQYLSGSEGFVIRLVLWPVTVVRHLIKKLWRELGRQLWRACVKAWLALWERIWRW